MGARGRAQRNTTAGSHINTLAQTTAAIITITLAIGPGSIHLIADASVAGDDHSMVQGFPTVLYHSTCVHSL